MNRLLCILLVSLTLSSVDLIADEPFSISPETTYITEPLLEDGRGVDYFTAIEKRLYPDTMQTDDNGYRIIVRELGDLSDHKIYKSDSFWNITTIETDVEPCRLRVYERLGLDPSIEPTSLYSEPYDFIQAYWEEHDIEGDVHEESDITDRPWIAEDSPVLAVWLEENSEGLDVIARALESPDYCAPIVRADESLSLYNSLSGDDYRLSRSFARGFQARAYYRIAQGDVDGAIDDIIACARLGRLSGQNGTIVHRLVGIACEGIAAAIGIALTEESSPTEAQLQRLLDAWNDLPSRCPHEETLKIERLFFLEFIQGLALDEYSLDSEGSFDNPVAQSLIKLDHDWNVVLRRVNLHYAALIRGNELYRLEETWRSWQRWSPIRLFTLGTSPSESFGDMLSTSYMPYTPAAREAGRRCQCCNQLHAITLAMLIHEQRNSTLPPPFITDADGDPMHSWRVSLLPYIGQQELYDKIRLEEPWDSEHNSQFHELDVPFYACPSDEDLQPGQTSYAVVVGEKTAFHERFAEFGPKCIPQILVVERQTPVCWMDPTQEFETDDISLGINYNEGPIGSNHPGGMNVGFRSASVHFIAETYSLDTIQKLFEGTCPPEEMP
jgi:hypothetical protein